MSHENAIITITLIVDTSLVKIYYFSLSQSPLAPWRVLTLTLISFVSVIGLFFIWSFAKNKSEANRSRNALHMNALHSLMTVSQNVLIALVLFLVFEVVFIFRYNVLLLTLIIWVSYSTAIVMLSVLAYRFFSWFRSKRNSVVLLYGISSVALVINAWLRHFNCSILHVVVGRHRFPSALLLCEGSKENLLDYPRPTLSIFPSSISALIP